MNVISGENVDLIFPFPLSEVKRTYGWNHCYRTLTETDDSPKSLEEFIPYMENVVRCMPTWGIIDKNHITNIKHEAPLVGIVGLEPFPGKEVRDGIVHIATARKAWRTGLIDEACHMVRKELFEGIPSLLRLSGRTFENNFPAKALLKRVGFKFEGVIEDSFLQDGKERNLVLFGLTRRNYNVFLNNSGESDRGSSGGNVGESDGDGGIDPIHDGILSD